MWGAITASHGQNEHSKTLVMVQHKYQQKNVWKLYTILTGQSPSG